MATVKPTGEGGQRERFIEAARELGCDESEETFRAAVRKVAKAPYVKHEPKGSRGKRPSGESESRK
jgi:hypothetical protein